MMSDRSARKRAVNLFVDADLLDEAAHAGKAVTIHVEKFNPALSLYRRLGFFPVTEESVYQLMRWERR